MPFTAGGPYSVGSPFTATEANNIENQIVAHDAAFGSVALDDPQFGTSATSDDVKLAAAMSYASARTYKPAILFANRAHTFANTYTPYNGMALIGMQAHPGNIDITTTLHNRVTCNANTFLSSTSLVSGVYIAGLAFFGNGSTKTSTFWTSTVNAQCCHIRDVTFGFFYGVLGNLASKFLNTACTFDGYWDTNGAYGCQFHVGGSDSRFWNNGHLIDGSTTANGGPASQTPLVWFDSQSCSEGIGPLYITSSGLGNWYSMLITGTDQVGNSGGGRGLAFMGGHFEGRNPTEASNGAVIKIMNQDTSHGPTVTMFAPWVSNGMGSAVATVTSNGTLDRGVIHVEGARVNIVGGFYQKTSAIADTVPWLYVKANASGTPGRVRIQNIETVDRGGTFTSNLLNGIGVPAYHVEAASFVTSDTSMASV